LFLFARKKNPYLCGALACKRTPLVWGGALWHFGNLLVHSFTPVLLEKEPYLYGALACKRAPIVWGSFEFREPTSGFFGK